MSGRGAGARRVLETSKLFLGIFTHLKDWIFKKKLSDLKEWDLKMKRDILLTKLCLHFLKFVFQNLLLWVGKKLTKKI